MRAEQEKLKARLDDLAKLAALHGKYEEAARLETMAALGPLVFANGANNQLTLHCMVALKGLILSAIEHLAKHEMDLYKSNRQERVADGIRQFSEALSEVVKGLNFQAA